MGQEEDDPDAWYRAVPRLSLLATIPTESAAEEPPAMFFWLEVPDTDVPEPQTTHIDVPPTGKPLNCQL